MKTIAVVGAGPGVGLEVARRFGREGFRAALLARDPGKLDNMVAALAADGIEAAAFPADVIDRPSLEAALRSAAGRFGSIDVMEYGPTPPKDSMRSPRDIDVGNEAFHLDLQVLGAIAAVRSVLPGMLARRAGGLLFTTAASAQHPAAMTGSFGVAAGGLLNYARLLHRDLAADGIRVGIVSIAGLVVQNAGTPPTGFPPGIPLVTAQSVADLHWDLIAGREGPEVFAGDVSSLLALPGLY